MIYAYKTQDIASCKTLIDTTVLQWLSFLYSFKFLKSEKQVNLAGYLCKYLIKIKEYSNTMTN